jgi:DNA-3-methyladenine glycosylase II
VARNLALVGGPAPLAVRTLLDTLGPEQGMLYYHLLLARLETRGDLGPSAISPRQAAS